MSPLNEETVQRVLKNVTTASGQDVISAGLISGVVVREGKVGFVITLDDKSQAAALSDACEAAVKALPGVSHVTVVTTAEAKPQEPAARKPAQWNTTPVEGVKKIIAVASGKGGVGKSTTAVNLAHALARAGKRVGLLDADIYGPSIPLMLGLSGQPAIADGKMVPLESGGIQCMSVGFITGEEAAVMRGPMISKTLTQLLRFTRWGGSAAALDFLIVDMPPGTGDVHLSMAQAASMAGVVIVTTPQEVALIDARKSAKMFQKVNVPLLGIVENMSGGIFGTGGGQRLAAEFSVPLLGQIPLDAGLVTAGDSGKAYGGALTRLYDAVAARL